MDLLRQNVTHWLARVTANIALKLANRVANSNSATTGTTTNTNPHQLEQRQLSQLLIATPENELSSKLFTPGLELRIPYTADDYTAIQSIAPSSSVQALTGTGLAEFSSYEVLGDESEGVIHIRMNCLPNLSQQENVGAVSIIMMGHSPAPEMASADVKVDQS